MKGGCATMTKLWLTYAHRKWRRGMSSPSRLLAQMPWVSPAINRCKDSFRGTCISRKCLLWFGLSVITTGFSEQNVPIPIFGILCLWTVSFGKCGKRHIPSLRPIIVVFKFRANKDMPNCLDEPGCPIRADSCSWWCWGSCSIWHLSTALILHRWMSWGVRKVEGTAIWFSEASTNDESTWIWYQVEYVLSHGINREHKSQTCMCWLHGSMLAQNLLDMCCLRMYVLAERLQLWVLVRLPQGQGFAHVVTYLFLSQWSNEVTHVGWKISSKGSPMACMSGWEIALSIRRGGVTNAWRTVLFRQDCPEDTNTADGVKVGAILAKPVPRWDKEQAWCIAVRWTFSSGHIGAGLQNQMKSFKNVFLLSNTKLLISSWMGSGMDRKIVRVGL